MAGVQHKSGCTQRHHDEKTPIKPKQGIQGTERGDGVVEGDVARPDIPVGSDIHLKGAECSVFDLSIML